MSDRLPGQRFRDQPSSAGQNQVMPELAQQTSYAPGQPALSPQRYRSNAPIIGVIVGVLVIGLAVVLTWVGTRPQPNTAGSSSPGAPGVTATPSYTPSPNWQGIEFSAPGYRATGYWQVSTPTWVGDTVTITTTISVDQGTMRFTFFALDNQVTELYETSGGTMETGSVSPGESQTGTVVLQMPQGDFTLYLATARGAQVAALLISG